MIKIKPIKERRSAETIMDEINMLDSLNSLGFTLPTPAYLIGALVFGIIGLVAYSHGKKASSSRIKWIGIVLMIYPYVISSTWIMYLVGLGLCVAWYYCRDD